MLPRNIADNMLLALRILAADDHRDLLLQLCGSSQTIMDPVMSSTESENVSSVPLHPVVTEAPVVPAFTAEGGRPPMVAVGMWLGKAQSKTRNALVSAYRQTRRASVSAYRGLQARAERAREEQPLPTLAVISGCAFAAGLALAVWRSQRS